MSIKKVVFPIMLCASVVSLNANAAEPNQADVVLSGVISAVTCDIDVNGVPGGTTVNTGMHISSDFTTANINNVTGTPVEMLVQLKNCSSDSNASAPATGGELFISGNVAANGNQNIFIGNDSQTGFMVLTSGGTSATDAIKNGGTVPLNVTAAEGASYTFNVAMASMISTPTAKLYSAPITISYASE